VEGAGLPGTTGIRSYLVSIFKLEGVEQDLEQGRQASPAAGLNNQTGQPVGPMGGTSLPKVACPDIPPLLNF
jgi:hypothetical protein